MISTTSTALAPRLRLAGRPEEIPNLSQVYDRTAHVRAHFPTWAGEPGPPQLVRDSPGVLDVCDPVEGDTYMLDGVTVDGFTRPAAWSGSTGPYDEAGRLTAPLAPGYMLGIGA
jgi:hypothetical protein